MARHAELRRELPPVQAPLHRTNGEKTMPTAVDADAYKKLWDMIRDVRVAMLTGRDGERLRSRPMVAMQDSLEGQLFFFTRAGSHKVGEMRGDEEVGLSCADPKGENYVSLSGTAHPVRDPDLVRSFWREPLRVWFPKGRTTRTSRFSASTSRRLSTGMRRRRRCCTCGAMRRR
ncbi:MAG TPA: pyridoxamine 5'-phosphate oxidase family protein [Acetobacteraceae bacterium]|nr:pyridoxamine 5'-phosphate oxidase family protein [Acetobacteraceae bacterium]